MLCIFQIKFTGSACVCLRTLGNFPLGPCGISQDSAWLMDPIHTLHLALEALGACSAWSLLPWLWLLHLSLLCSGLCLPVHTPHYSETQDWCFPRSCHFFLAKVSEGDIVAIFIPRRRGALLKVSGQLQSGPRLRPHPLAPQPMPCPRALLRAPFG